jgi:hypothetical protein
MGVLLLSVRCPPRQAQFVGGTAFNKRYGEKPGKVPPIYEESGAVFSAKALIGIWRR